MGSTVGLVADSPAAMLQMRALMEEIGQPVTYAMTAKQVIDSTRQLRPSLWIVISEDAADIFEVLSEWSDATIFLAEGMPPKSDVVHYPQWKSSFADKLSKMLDQVERDGHAASPDVPAVIDTFEEVWVLAASLGGPESMRVFLSGIQPEIPVAFVYAQHIEPGFDRVLPKVLGKASQLPIFFGENGCRLKRGQVAVFPAHTYTAIDRRGNFHVHSGREWEKPYTPNINQIIDNIAQFYRSKMGVIIFSGTCDDGASASVRLHRAGVNIWAQQPEECICAAMPEAVITAGAARYVGTAEALAQRLNERFARPASTLELSQPG